MKTKKSTTLTAYETDFYAWTQEQSELMRGGHFDELDIDHLVDEIASIGHGVRQELTARLEILLVHMLTWQYQNNDHGAFEWLTIKELKVKFVDCLNKNPSLKHQLDDCLVRAYRDAVLVAAMGNDINENGFPTVCPWTPEQVINYKG